jgi:hypothetical protein
MGDVLQLQPLPIAPCSTLDCHNPGIRSRGCNVCSASLTSCAQHLISTFLNCVAVVRTFLTSLYPPSRLMLSTARNRNPQHPTSRSLSSPLPNKHPSPPPSGIIPQQQPAMHHRPKHQTHDGLLQLPHPTTLSLQRREMDRPCASPWIPQSAQDCRRRLRVPV